MVERNQRTGSRGSGGRRAGDRPGRNTTGWARRAPRADRGNAGRPL